MNNYYVYLHKSVETNTVFYLGKGINNRAYSKKARTKSWFEIADKGYSVEIIKDKLSFSEAEDLEAELLDSPDNSWNLVNICKGRIPSDLLETVKHVYYDETSPTFLRWKYATVRGKRKTNGVAGSIQENGYATLMISRKHYLIHRLIWVLLNNQEIPRGYVVNHIDCNPANNNSNNLEVITFAENNRRKSCHKLITTGVNKTKTCPRGRGVFYSYTGTCTINNKVVNKSFAVLKHGEAEAFRLACEWRKEQIKLLNEQGAGYTERHGT